MATHEPPLMCKKFIANWQRKTGSASRSIHRTLKRNDNNKRVQYLIHRHSLQPAKFQCYSVTHGSERGKNRGRKGTERKEWQAYPGSCATSSQISMFFAQSISLSLSLVAAFTISSAIFSPCASFTLLPLLLSLTSKSRPVFHSAGRGKGREEIPASCNEAIPSVKIALLSINRSLRARKEAFCPSRKNEEREMQSRATRSHRREQKAREVVARTNLDRP